MKFKIILILVFIISSRGLNPGYADTEIYWTRSGRNVEVLSGSILVKFRSGTASSVKSTAFKSIGAKRVGGIAKLGIDIIKVPADKTMSEIVQQFSLRADVLYAEPIYIVHAFKLPEDIYSTLSALEARQWGLAKIDAPGGWDIETGTAVVVAVLDTGIDLDHIELASNIWNNPNSTSLYEAYNSTDSVSYKVQYDTNGWDFINHDNDPDDDENHGTHVAGIIGANSTNSIVGIGWDVKLMAVKVLDSNGDGTSLSVINGIIYAADRGADVINMSLRLVGSPESQAVRDAVNYAYNSGVVLVAATGNDGKMEISYPAAYENVIAVGATDINDLRASFSNYGAELDVVAPGVDIYSTIIGGYGDISGTSMACPYVAGLAALIVSYWEREGINPNWTPHQVRNTIIANADDINSAAYPGWDMYLGYGRINVKKTLESGMVTVDDKKTIVYPNPFNPDVERTLIVLPADYDGVAKKLRIYSLDGQLVKETGASGNAVTWDGRNNNGEICASGLYFFYIDTTTGGKKGKITIIK